MVKAGILARMETKPGKEEEVAAFQEGALPLVQEEPDTVTWYAIRIGPVSLPTSPLRAPAGRTCVRFRNRCSIH